MKKIGIDARLYFQTGVGTYLRNLIHYLQNMAGNDLIFYIYILNKDSANIHFQNKNFIKREVPYKWHSIGEQFGFNNILNKDDLDLMHFTYFGYPVLYRKKFVVTIHDLTPLLFKTGKASTQNRIFYEIKHSIFKYVLSSQIRNSLHIITPTQSVKKQIIQKYGAQFENKITSLYEGVDYQLSTIKENISLKDKFKQPFFIYIGTFYPHKNVERLVKAYAKVNSLASLILVGPEDHFTSQIIKLIKNLKQEDRIKLYTKATREDLMFFYKNALALIHPSLSEGFGLPIIESMYFGLPIVASNIDVFQELLGEKYLQFNPQDENDIAEKIKQFLDEKSKSDHSDLIKKYSFEEMAKKTFQIYSNFM